MKYLAIFFLPIIIPVFMLASLIVGLGLWIHFSIITVQQFKKGWE